MLLIFAILGLGLLLAFAMSIGGGTKIAENVGKLKDQMGECMKAMEALHEKCLAAETAKDEKSKSLFEAEFQAKSLEFAALENRFKTCKEFARQNEVLKEAETLGKTFTADGRVIPDHVSAEATDHEKAEREKEKVFISWFGGKTLTQNELNVLRPQLDWKSENHDISAKNGIAVPSRFADAILPERRVIGQSFMGKALPLISSAEPGSDLFLKEFRPEVLMYHPEPVRLFDLAMKVPCDRGTVLWPKLVQPAPTDEDTANEFGEIGAVATQWTAEGAEKPETEPKFTQLEIKAWEVSGYTELSHQLIARSQVDIIGLLRELFRSSLLHKIDYALLRGNGVGKPTGIIGTANIGAPTRVLAGAIGFDDFVELEHSVAPQLRPGSIYIIKDSALKTVKKLKDLLNRPLYMPNPAGPIFDTINGYRYVATQRLPALGAAGDVLFGQPRQYMCPVEQEVIIAASDDYNFRKRVRSFVAFAQVGGKVTQERAWASLAAEQTA